MNIVQEMREKRCCMHQNTRRQVRLRMALARAVGPAARRLLLAYEDEKDLARERSAQDSYTAGLRDGIQLMTSLFGGSGTSNDSE